MEHEEFKKHGHKAFTPWADDQLSYLEDELTSFMTQLQGHIREGTKLRNQIKEVLDEIKKNRKRNEEQNDLTGPGKGDLE